MAKFSKQQTRDMNNYQSTSNKDFDEMIINKDVIMFNKSSQESLDDDYSGESPYGQYDELGANFNSAPSITKNVPILTKRGAEVIHNDIKEINDNQKRLLSKKAMNMDNAQIDKLNNEVDLEDKDLNSDLRFDLQDKDNIDKSVQYNDGADIDHPEIYQRTQSDGIDLENRGDLNAEEYSDGPSFSDGYDSDKKMTINSIKAHPRSINYVITNKTKPIVNNEEEIQDSQTATSYLAGREETNDSVGIYVACANTPNNRKRLNQILKDNSPKFQKAYQKDIMPYAQKMTMQQHSLVKERHKHAMNRKMSNMMKRTWKQRTQSQHNSSHHIATRTSQSKGLSKQQRIALKNKGIQRN